jgi:hypothetical protein
MSGTQSWISSWGCPGNRPDRFQLHSHCFGLTKHGRKTVPGDRTKTLPVQSRLLDEDAAHGLGRSGKEVAAAVLLLRLLVATNPRFLGHAAGHRAVTRPTCLSVKDLPSILGLPAGTGPLAVEG